MEYPDLLFDVVSDKLFFAIRFADISEEWELGVHCFRCERNAPITMTRWQFIALAYHTNSEQAQLRHNVRRFRCTTCGNTDCNRPTIVGRSRRWRVLPALTFFVSLPRDPAPRCLRAVRLGLGGRVSLLL